MAGVDHDMLAAWLTRLQLTGIRDQLDNLLDEAAEKQLTLREAFAMLVEREVSRKDERRIEMALKIAHFPAVRELADFDFKAQPSVDKRQIQDLAAARWVAHGDAVLLLGSDVRYLHHPPRSSTARYRGSAWGRRHHRGPPTGPARATHRRLSGSFHWTWGDACSYLLPLRSIVGGLFLT